MTALKRLVLEQIANDGPISLADYMALCLLHPQHGYYTTHDPFGAKGDFTTAPEISQMFGELLGLALAQSWIDQNRPSNAILAEIGPGRGTLMADILRAICKTGFAPEIHLVEASPALRTVQGNTLGDARITWHETPAGLPQAPVFLVANEFFDALPMRQFQRAAKGWSERRITARNDALGFALTPPVPLPALDYRADTKPGDIVEICPSAPGIITEVSRRIRDHGGAALIVDYGDWRSLGDTFQAMRHHAPADPLQDPGHADLTTHVDFEALARAADCATSTMIAQGTLLERLGIAARARKLAANLEGAALETHITAYRRLTHAGEMGTLFKAIALYPDGGPVPPGFDPAP